MTYLKGDLIAPVRKFKPYLLFSYKKKARPLIRKDLTNKSKGTVGFDGVRVRMLTPREFL